MNAMNSGRDASEELIDIVTEACAKDKQLNIVGGNTKSFLGSPERATDNLSTSGHRGVIQYEPGELVLQARSGTRLKEIEQLLSGEGQMLGFEPPGYGDDATIGGVVAAGISGPMRPYKGAVRDFVLGMTVVNGKGEKVSFGGQVMKNVAGYDVSRLMVGSLGVLALSLDVSFKVIPKPACEITCCLELKAEDALAKMLELSSNDFPLTGASWLDGKLHIRLSGNDSTVDFAKGVIGGEVLENGNLFWSDLNEQRLEFFRSAREIWRLSVPPNTPIIPEKIVPESHISQTNVSQTHASEGLAIIDWGGAQRWYASGDKEDMKVLAENSNGHATLFRSESLEKDRFHPLDQALTLLHKRLKQSFDPKRIFNPGRMYSKL